MTARVAVYRVHRLLGLALGALIGLMSITGGTLVLHREIESVVSPARHRVTPSADQAPPAPLAAVLAQVAGRAPPGYRPLRIEPGLAPDETHKILFVGPDARTRWSAFVHPGTGAVLWSGEDQALFTPWLLNLHMQLRAGRWGYYLTATAGIALALLGITGLIVHRARFAELFRRPLRLDRGWRAGCADLHRWVGVASIYFCLVLGITGAIYALTSAAKLGLAPKVKPASFAVSRLAPIEPALDFARRQFPAAELFRIALPADTSAPLVVTMLHRTAPVWEKFSRIEFDPATGAVRVVRDARAAPPREKVAAMLAPLHFGFYGSPLVKWLYAFGGFAPALLAATGLALAIQRRRRTAIVPPAVESASGVTSPSALDPASS